MAVAVVVARPQNAPIAPPPNGGALDNTPCRATTPTGGLFFREEKHMDDALDALARARRLIDNEAEQAADSGQGMQLIQAIRLGTDYAAAAAWAVAADAEDGVCSQEAEAAAWARLQRYAQQVAAVLRGA